MTQPDASGISRMKLPNVSQIGIVVKNIPEAVAGFTKLLNIGCWYRTKGIHNEAVYRGRPVIVDIDIVLTFQGGVEIELIEVKGSEENVYSDILAKSGGGIHHLGFSVTDYDKKLALMKAGGIEVLQSGVITTAGASITRYAYLDTIRQCGVISELIATTLKGIPMPHCRLIMDIGRLTGDVERVSV